MSQPFRNSMAAAPFIRTSQALGSHNLESDGGVSTETLIFMRKVAAFQKLQELVDLDGNNSVIDFKNSNKKQKAQGVKDVSVVEKPTKTGSRSWPIETKLALARLAKRFEVWPTDAAPGTVGDRWARLLDEVTTAPYREMFEGRGESKIKAQVAGLLKIKRKSMERAQRGLSSTPLKGGELELDKVMGECVDEISACRAAAAAKKKVAEEQGDAYDASVIAARNAFRDCYGPGARAASFAPASSSCVPRGDGWVGGGLCLNESVGDGGGDGSEKGGGADRGGDWGVDESGEGGSQSRCLPAASRLIKARAVKAFDDILVGKLAALGLEVDMEKLQEGVGASDDEMDMFVARGWENGELGWKTAVRLFQGAVSQLTGTCEGDAAGGHLNEGPVRARFRGLAVEALRVLCGHYGANERDLNVVTTDVFFRMYTESPAGNQLPWEEVVKINRALVQMLLAGSDYGVREHNEDDGPDACDREAGLGKKRKRGLKEMSEGNQEEQDRIRGEDWA